MEGSWSSDTFMTYVRAKMKYSDNRGKERDGVDFTQLSCNRPCHTNLFNAASMDPPYLWEISGCVNGSLIDSRYSLLVST